MSEMSWRRAVCILILATALVWVLAYLLRNHENMSVTLAYLLLGLACALALVYGTSRITAISVFGSVAALIDVAFVYGCGLKFGWLEVESFRLALGGAFLLAIATFAWLRPLK